MLRAKIDSLIKALNELYMRVSAKLLEIRMDRSGVGRGAGATVDIGDRLNRRLTKIAVKRVGRTNAKEMPSGANQASAVYEPSRPDAGGGLPQADKPSPVNEVVAQSGKERWARGMEPPMGEQLKKRTIEHIHHAFSLTREGKPEAAETYAELAETALETAAEYLPEAEFIAFKDEVEKLIAASRE